MVRDRRSHHALPVAAALLTLLLSSDALFAKPRAAAAPAPEATFARFWRALPMVFRSTRGLLEKEGSALDPFGVPKPQSVTEPSPGNAAGPSAPSHQ
jgi:hypothetical protein